MAPWPRTLFVQVQNCQRMPACVLYVRHMLYAYLMYKTFIEVCWS